MKASFYSRRHFIFFTVTALVAALPWTTYATTVAVSLAVEDTGTGALLAPRFLGLSYETSMLLPNKGRYYFDPSDQALVNTFRTLGVKSLRVGGNSVDDPRVAVPGEKDIDMLFNFARAADVKVIYSFRLKNGNAKESARLARYISEHDADALDCFSVGNEPNFYDKTFAEYMAHWKPQYESILAAAPDAMFDGPSTAGHEFYVIDFVNAMFSGGHIAMASDHYYFLGSGRAAEKDPAASRARFLSNRLHEGYGKDYARVGAVLAAKGVPYRIDEMNSCYNGGAKNSSDTYASTLWALDCTHWWAARHIVGVNYHTGESVGRDGGFGAANYAAFVHRPGGEGFDMRPQAYALLAFTQGAQGRPLGVKLAGTPPGFNMNAYAYRGQGGVIYLTLINKSYGAQGRDAVVKIQLPADQSSKGCERLDLRQTDNDVAAKTGVSLGGAEVSAQGLWEGKWEAVRDGSKLHVPASSAAVLRFGGE